MIRFLQRLIGAFWPGLPLWGKPFRLKEFRGSELARFESAVDQVWEGFSEVSFLDILTHGINSREDRTNAFAAVGHLLMIYHCRRLRIKEGGRGESTPEA